MLTRYTAITIILLGCILSPCFGQAESDDLLGGVHVYWRGDEPTGEDLEALRNMGVDGCLLPAVGVQYDSQINSVTPEAMNLTGLKNEDAIGLDFHLVMNFKLPPGGWHKNPDITLPVMLMSDMARRAVESLEAADGRIVGVILTTTGVNPDFATLARFLNQLRNNPAFTNVDVKFGILAEPDWADSDKFPELADAADYFALNLTAYNITGKPPQLIDESWVTKSVKKFEGFGKPIITILPMSERVLKHDAVGNVMDMNIPLSFDTVMNNSDNIGSDSAANTTATISSATTIEDYKIPADTKFTLLKSSPGDLVGVLNAIKKKEYKNVAGLALDGYPYVPSTQGYAPAEYVASLKGSSKSVAEKTRPTEEKLDEMIRADEKSRTSGMWVIGVGVLIAAALTLVSLMRKKKLVYDEDSDSLKPPGDGE